MLPTELFCCGDGELMTGFGVKKQIVSIVEWKIL